MESAKKNLQNSYNFKNIDELLKYYDSWETYEQDLMALGYFGPIACTALLYKHVDRDAKILEVGCGPGNVGRHLRLMNFTNIQGLDGSQGMVQRATKSQVYNKVYHHIINETPLPTQDFDVLLGVGVFTVGHFPQGAMKLCFDHLKSGGYFCFSGTQKVLDSYFQEEFEYVQANSRLIDSTQPQFIVPFAGENNQYLAKGYLFKKLTD